MKSIDKLLVLTAALALVLGLTACGKSSPKDVAKSAVEAQLSGDIQGFYSLLCSDDQETMTYDHFLSKYTIPEDAQALFDMVPEAREVLKAGGYKEIVNGETATVTYVLTVPDMDKIIKEAISFDILQKMITGGRMRSLADLPEEMKVNIREYMSENKIPTIDTPQTMTLVRENDIWRVSLSLRDALNLGRMPHPFVLK